MSGPAKWRVINKTSFLHTYCITFLYMLVVRMIAVTRLDDPRVTCNTRKYPYLSHRRDFLWEPPPLWEFQLSFICFIKFFCAGEPPPPGNYSPFFGGSYWIFWNCTLKSTLGSERPAVCRKITFFNLNHHWNDTLGDLSIIVNCRDSLV